MPAVARIGIQIVPGDPFWVQVREVILQRATELLIDIVELGIHEVALLATDVQIEAVEDLVVQELDALILNMGSMELIDAILERNLPVIFVSEFIRHHPRFVSRIGLTQAGAMIGDYCNTHLPAGAAILIVGGVMLDEMVDTAHFGDSTDWGISRITGCLSALDPAKAFKIYRLPCLWSQEEAYPVIETWCHDHAHMNAARRIDAIFGLSDLLALAACEICSSYGISDSKTLIFGINGDPLALAAVAAGRMTATVETDVVDIANQAIDLALCAARGQPLPDTFQNAQRLVTAEQVAEVATRKLISLAALPTRLVGVNRQSEQLRVVQLETSMAIDQEVGVILDRNQLSLAIARLIRDNYGFDQARLWLWNAAEGRLSEVSSVEAGTIGDSITPDSAGPLSYALVHNQSIFIPNVASSHRFAADPLCPEVHSRVIVPVHLGGQITGLLDLQSWQAIHRTREEIAGLQLLADQLGIAMRNAELYGEALEARAIAERADRLKTALLANVSHELRTPLNIILGYSRTALDALTAGVAPSPDLAHDLRHIYQSGEHLLRLINDLLDLSRSEIGELDLLIERVDTSALLEEVFRSSAGSFNAPTDVKWQLMLPAEPLPALAADSVRLRQILLNLLHNAHKFTEQGHVTLGADSAGSEVHIWVADSGIGISEELQGRMFEPFVSHSPGPRRREGIGLGLSITRRLLELHHGRVIVESQPGLGSTFHIYLPIQTQPELSADAVGSNNMLLFVSEAPTQPASLLTFARQRGLVVRTIQPSTNLVQAARLQHPAFLALDSHIPEIESWHILEALRSQPQSLQFPVMLWYNATSAAQHVPSPTTGILLKPLGDQTLIQALDILDPRYPDGSILLVEDDPHMRSFYRRLISQHFSSYAILEAADGPEALELLRLETPCLIVLDLVMPGLDGFAVLEALRAEMRTASVPVLVLSGKALSTDDIRRLSAARVVFQAKDILSSHELADSLRYSLDRTGYLPPQTSALVKGAVAFIQDCYAQPLTRQAIADHLGVSKDYLGRIFQQELQLSPWEFLIRYRVLRAKYLLQTTSSSITEIAAQVGFETASYFSTIFHREVGSSPREFRNKH